MTQADVWITQGFDQFSQGTFGNAGQNLYVSRAGVLQRIHQYDLNKNGYFDLIFCNSQNHWEKPPAYVYADPGGEGQRIELPSDGAWSAAVADLNGDGYDDLVLAMRHNGIRQDLNSFIYYGSAEGLSERRQQLLPTPFCTSVACGDFNGDGRPDLAFLCHGQLRLFYQSGLGFEPQRFIDLNIHGEQLAASDLDGDGYAELIVRAADGQVRVYWGGQEGIDPGNASLVATVPGTINAQATEAAKEQHVEAGEDAPPLVRVIHLKGHAHLFVARTQSAFLVPVALDRSFGQPLVLACPSALAIATGDINGNGYQDLVLACRQSDEDGESSWIYWGDENGHDEARRTRLPSHRACDVAIGDLNGNGYADIILCQNHTDESYTHEALLYRGTPAGVADEPLRFLTHDARRVFIAHTSADKNPQLIFANYYSRNLLGNIQPSIYVGGPDGFSPEQRLDIPGWGAVEAICCDINDDGHADIVLANASENSVGHDPGSYILLNGPNGFPNQPDFRLPTTRAHGVACADLNRNGYLDLIFCGFNNPELLIFYGSAEGFDTANPQRIRLEHEGKLYKEPRWIYLADLNNNGWLDLVVPMIDDDRSFILWGGPDGFAMANHQLLSVVRGACARAADLTGNGYLDLIIGGHMPSRGAPHDSFVYIYWNGPEGLHEDRRTLLPANTINSMAIADFNNDGLLDLFICSYHDGRVRDIDSYLYWNRAGRGFSATDRSRFFTHSASGCVAADFNEDGRIDLAIAYHKVYGDHIGHSAVWWNGPNGFEPGRVTKLPTSGPHGMVSVGPRNIADCGPEEYYISRPFNLPAGTQPTKISWQAEIQPKTWVKAQLRVANTETALDQAPWLGPAGEANWFENNQAVAGLAAPWIQYRLALGATNSGCTPRVTEVRLDYE